MEKDRPEQSIAEENGAEAVFSLAEELSAEERLPLTEVELTADELFASSHSQLEKIQQKADAGEDILGDIYDFQSQIRELTEEIKGGALDARYTSMYFEMVSKKAELSREHLGRNYEDALSQVIYSLGEDSVSEAFAQEETDGPFHNAILDRLRAAAKPESDYSTLLSSEELHVLRKAHGLESLTELLGQKGDDYSNEMHSLLLKTDVIRKIRFEENPYDSEKDYAQYVEDTRKWFAELIVATSDFSPEEAIDYAFSASRRSDEEAAIKIVEKLDYFGAERIRKISEFSGIQGLEGYSIEQLELMESLVDEPEVTAEMLSEHDVSVGLINRSGDHNGVLGSVAETYDTSGHMLFFEINSMADIYKSMTKLKKLGIKPSTMVLAAHSGPGQFMVVDSRGGESEAVRDIATVAGSELVDRFNEDEQEPDAKYKQEKAYALRGMRGMTRLVDEYMQPSRSIEDDESERGRKKIIFNACDAGTEVDAVDMDASGEKTIIGVESVVSQLGRDLAESGLQSSVDIYGAAAGMQSKRSQRGVRFTALPRQMGEERLDISAQRTRVENGIVQNDEIEEISLPRAA